MAVITTMDQLRFHWSRALSPAKKREHLSNFFFCKQTEHHSPKWFKILNVRTSLTVFLLKDCIYICIKFENRKIVATQRLNLKALLLA